MTDKIVVLTTCDSEEQATRIARHLVEHRVAACVNIVPGMRSIYRWNGKIEDTSELLLVIKSRQSCCVLNFRKFSPQRLCHWTGRRHARGDTVVGFLVLHEQVDPG